MRASTIENTEAARSLTLRRWGAGWQAFELHDDGDRRLLRGAEKARALRSLGIYRRGAACHWPGRRS